MRNPLDASLAWLGRGLARAGVIDARRAERTVSLAWPRIVTGIARLSQRVVDFAMVGAAIGPAALAGLAFALAYWQVGNVVSIGVSGGTISQVSQRFRAGDEAATDRAVKQGLLLALAITLPLQAVLVALPGELVGLLGGAPDRLPRRREPVRGRRPVRDRGALRRAVRRDGRAGRSDLLPVPDGCLAPLGGCRRAGAGRLTPTGQGLPAGAGSAHDAWRALWPFSRAVSMGL